MPQIAILFLVIILFVQVLSVVMHIAVYAAVATGIGFLAAFFVLWCQRTGLINQVGRHKIPDDLAAAVGIALEGSQVSYKLDRAILTAQLQKHAPLRLGLCCGIALTIISLLALSDTKLFTSVTFFEWVIPGTLLFFICAGIAVAVLAISVTAYDPMSRLVSAVAEALDQRFTLSHIPRQKLQELETIGRDIAALGHSLNLELETDFEEQLQTALCSKGPEGLRDPIHLNVCTEKVCQNARAEHGLLRSAVTSYQNVERLFQTAERAARRAGSARLLRELDELHEGLQSHDLMSLILCKQWQDFGEVLAMMEAELSAIRDDAQNLAEGGSSGTRASGGASGQRHGHQQQGSSYQGGPMTVEQAFCVLGIPSTASAAQIKSVYFAMAKAWHSDTGGSGDDSRMKELNAAKDCLKKAGRLS